MNLKDSSKRPSKVLEFLLRRNSDDEDVSGTGFLAVPGLGQDFGERSDRYFPFRNEDTRDPRQMCLFGDRSDCLDNLTVSNTTDDDSIFILGGVLKRESWVLPMLVVSAINITVILAFELFVVCKAARNSPSRRHLFLGQMLLLGLLLGSTLGFAYAVEPNEASCAAIRFGTGLAYALIYAALLVKLVFLISLNTGVYLPASYQALLFLFILIVQVVIGIQWLSGKASQCIYTTRDHLLSLLYVVFLIIFVSALCFKSWNFRDNYRESKYIGVLMAVTVPVWLAWNMAALILHESFHAACLGFGLLACCSLTFVIMFVPKSRQLSAIGKEGIYLEDQEDRYSYRSNPYSPSFYHFQPAGANNKTLFTTISGSIAGNHKDSPRPPSPLFKPSSSYAGFHRPLRVVPPSATTTPSTPIHPPPSYSTRTYFPSHFFPEKLHQYWQYYYPPRIPEVYKRLPGESLNNIYTSLNDNDRTKSVNPNVYFYRSTNYQYPGFVY